MLLWGKRINVVSWEVFAAVFIYSQEISLPLDHQVTDPLL